MIDFNDFAKIDIRIGEIKSVEKIPDTDKLLVFKVDVGEDFERQIVSGVAEYFENYHDLIGKQVPVVINLEPRKIRGVESQGMILYVSGDSSLVALEPSKKIQNGSTVK